MDDKITISTFQLFQLFPDAESARLYLEARLWPNGVRCPICASGERIGVRKGGYYRCNACAEDFTVRTGTVFERSHVPLHNMHTLVLYNGYKYVAVGRNWIAGTICLRTAKGTYFWRAHWNCIVTNHKEYFELPNCYH